MFCLNFSKMKRLNKKWEQEREKIIEALRRRDRVTLHSIIGKRALKNLFEKVAKINSRLADGKVTVDTKRILRLPSSLHSKVSMVCMVVKNPESFEPLRDALPGFVKRKP